MVHFERWSYHDNPDDFFELGPEYRSLVVFSRNAAKAVIQRAASKGLAILGYEGGVFEDGRFGPRMDAIWSRLYSHTGKEFLEIGNLRALGPLDEEPAEYNAFIITAMSVDN